MVTIVVQVNGRLRAKFEAEADSDEEMLQKTALSLDRIMQYTDGKTVRKIIAVKNRLINIVVT